MNSKLVEHAKRLQGVRLSSLAHQAGHGEPLQAAGWKINLSRQRLDTDSQAALLNHAQQSGLMGHVDALFSARHVNPSEDRPALHWALRAQMPPDIPAARDVQASVAQADAFAARVHAGEALSHDGKPFRAVVHIGIGGSDFGPRLIYDALAGAEEQSIELRFCANLDPFDLEAALSGLDPNTTLLIGVSKSFGTEETLYNLDRARKWMENSIGAEWARHVALVTSNEARAKAWANGAEPYIFDLPLSVGGRFSLWSSASLSCACVLGPDAIAAFRAGAAAMDEHVRTSDAAENVAVRLALLDYWNTSILGHSQRVVLAYARRLRMLPTYLQQLEMESNGKSVSSNGEVIETATAPALWGGEGSVGQHSYHQWLHQGTQIVPTEFILAVDSGRDTEGNRALAAHALAQAEVLANGRSIDDILADEPGLDPAIAAQKVHGGDRPSTFLFHDQFGPHAVGALIALYEHRTYLAGCLWGINPFDQWGVERGKTMADQLKGVLTQDSEADDLVTAQLAAWIRAAL